MKSSIIYSVSLALLSAAAVLAQSGPSTKSDVGTNGNNLDRPTSDYTYRGSSSSSNIELPSEQKSQELTGLNSGAPSTASPPASQPEEEESSDSTPFYITAPSSSVTYTKGSIATIEWINGIDEPFKIKVLAGNDPKSMQPTKVSITAQGSKGEYKWKVPEFLSDGTYAFNFIFANKVGGKTVSQESYSEQFKIVSPGGSSSEVV